MKYLFIFMFASFLTHASELNKQSSKKMFEQVKYSLWYEGVTPFRKSIFMFKVKQIEQLLQAQRQVEAKPMVFDTEELLKELI